MFQARSVGCYTKDVIQPHSNETRVTREAYGNSPAESEVTFFIKGGPDFLVGLVLLLFQFLGSEGKECFPVVEKTKNPLYKNSETALKTVMVSRETICLRPVDSASNIVFFVYA